MKECECTSSREPVCDLVTFFCAQTCFLALFFLLSLAKHLEFVLIHVSQRYTVIIDLPTEPDLQ